MDDSKPGIESTTRVEDSTPSNQTLCDWDPQEERRLLRRIDWRLIPVIILLFILNFLDRVNFAVARLQGLEEDLGLSDVEYQTGISILFAGYVSMQVPSNMILNKVSRPSWYIAGLVAIWGAITTATGGVQNASGAIALRFFLGVVEAGFTPGIVFYCSRWYKRNEIAFRVTIFTCGNLAAQAFGGLIGAGILSGMEGKGGLRSWRWLFIIEGAITVVLSSAALFLMPDYPRTTKWLSEREKHIAQTRLVLDVGLADEDDKGNAWHGLKLALLDPIVWILGLSYFLLVMGMTFSFFFPTIARSLGYGRIVTLLLTAPPWAFAVVVSVVVAWFADRFTARFIPIAGTVGTSFIGAVIAMNTSTIGPRYFSFFLMTIGFSATPLILTWASTCIARPPAKRAAAIAIINGMGNTASIPASYMWPLHWGPVYRQSFGITFGFLLASTVLAFALRLYLARLNKKLDREEGTAFETNESAVKRTAELTGITQEDAANHSKSTYRYIY